jgi:hypothetical protein
MRALKVLVIVMGVLLVAGIIALGFAVQYRANHPRPVPLATGPAIGPASVPNAMTLDLPAGAKVVGAEASGDRLVVRVDLAASRQELGGEELIVVNLATGLPIATVMLRPKPATP